MQRAGPAAAYREQYGQHDPVIAIGREPRAPEARAAWHAAAHSLGLNVAGRDLAIASHGDLWAARARYERELDRAPEHVGDKLRLIARAAREEYTEAVLTRARARAAAGPEREELAAQANAHEQRAGALADRERELVEADEQRAAWHAATEPAREQARAATAELRRRHRDLGLLPYRTERDDPDVGRDRQDVSRPGSRYASAVSCSTCSGIRSRCSTWYPSDVSHSAYRPGPPPMSATMAGAAGRRRSTISVVRVNSRSPRPSLSRSRSMPRS